MALEIFRAVTKGSIMPALFDMTNSRVIKRGLSHALSLFRINLDRVLQRTSNRLHHSLSTPISAITSFVIGLRTCNWPIQ
ncbi:hypothetical protein RB195_000015 [Necator americanus]|uniref:Uncharacterized protein n=1 Tax=Necator americanus TaxID=51031 RepID=A0ABR1D7K7_NECAM